MAKHDIPVSKPEFTVGDLVSYYLEGQYVGHVAGVFTHFLDIRPLRAKGARVARVITVPLDDCDAVK